MSSSLVETMGTVRSAHWLIFVCHTNNIVKLDRGGRDGHGFDARLVTILSGAELALFFEVRVDLRRAGSST
jgi:hypothetical protein